MGRIVNPNSMRMEMNSIKRNVDSYSMSYRKSKTTLAKHSHESSKAKGLTANAILNQLSCYESLMDMFVIVAENISKDCDAMSAQVGNEYLNEDNINSMIEVQEGIRKRCTERIEHYRHRETEFASYPILSGYCRLQIQRNYSIRSNAETIINLMERKLEKINEIEQSTSELFLAEKAALEKIEGCIEELKKSGKGGFTFRSLPAWATNMNKALLEKYREEMLSGGRVNEAFVKKFSDLTLAEMTPAELAVYEEYVKFLMFKAKPEDMNIVIKHSYSKTIDGVMVPKDSAYELAATIDIATKVYSMKSTEPVDSQILERSTIMQIALTRGDTFEPGEVSLKDGHYRYEYKKYRRSDSNHATPIVSKESYKTIDVPVDAIGGAGYLNKAKVEYLKNLMRKNGTDYAADIFKAGVNIGIGIALPEMTVGEQITYGVMTSAPEILDSSGQNEDFGIKSEDIGTMADKLYVRTSIAEPGTKEGTLVYNIYPTNETEDRLEFYNDVFKHYKMEQVRPGEIWNNPEGVNEKFGKLREKIKAKSYRYNNDLCEDFDALEKACDKYIEEKDKK